jgi:hypothetical protein
MNRTQSRQAELCERKGKANDSRSARKRHAPKIRWTAALRRAPALSMRQPWAWLIVNGYKDVENRSWSTRHRGPLLIHAGQARPDPDAIAWVTRWRGIRLPPVCDFGGIVGVVELEDCRAYSDSRWHQRGATGWVLRKPRRLPFLKTKGALGLFKP